MPDINNPHDSFARELLSREEIAADFLVNYLPPKIASALDPVTVTPRKDSFVDEELREHFSDLVYEVGFKDGGVARIIVLIDHKSDPEKWVGLQLLRYEIRLWQDAKNAKADHLPLVIPVVLYHGRKRWRVPQSFGGLFATAQMKLAREFVPDFKYHLCDLSSFRDEELKGGIELRAGLMLLKHVFSERLKEPLVRIFRWLGELPDRRRREYLKTAMYYLSSAKARLTSTELREFLEEALPEKVGELMETFTETWIREGLEKGLQQGLQQGWEKGLQQGLAVTALAQLQWRFGALSEQTKERIAALPTEKCQQLSIALLSFNSPDDLANWLRLQAEEG